MTAQPLFIVQAYDKVGALPTRLAHYDAHRAFLADTTAYGVEIVMSGPLVADDGETMIGSHFLIASPDRAHVEAFNRADPFYMAGIWDTITITRFLRRRG